MSDGTPGSPGWFEDPDDPDQLRYFDGILWTAHVTPLRSRSRSATATDTAASTSQASTAQGSGVTQQGSAPARPQGTGGPGSPTSSWPTLGPLGGAPAPSTRPGPSAPDGTPLASVWSRVLAYIVDAVILNVVALVLGGWFLFRAAQPAMAAMTQAMAAGDAEALNAAMSRVDATQLAIYTGIKLLATLAYGLFFLTRWSATPAMLAVGISVRRSGQAGVLGWEAATRRTGFMVALDALTNVPLVSLAALLIKVLNLTRPFYEPQRRALHDVVADTLVVKGPQPPRTER